MKRSAGRLGIYTEIASQPQNGLENQRKVTDECGSTGDERNDENRAGFDGLGASGDFYVQRFYLQSLARELVPEKRVGWCLRRVALNVAGGDGWVRIMHNSERNTAHYSGLVVCGLLWACPVCAAKISEGRRVELAAAIKASGYHAVLVTYTLRHNVSDRLKSLLDDTLEAYRKLKSGRRWQGVKASYQWVGSVRSLEVTHGGHGWHPHIHELVLLAAPLDDTTRYALLSELRDMWLHALAKTGRDASYLWGIDVRDAAAEVADYVAKFGREPIEEKRWTLEHELTKSAVKKARRGGRSPMQLLWDYGQGDQEAGQLWREYALTFHGRNQLVWSRGLRALLGLGAVVSDAELAKECDPAARILAELDRNQWEVVLRNEARGELLRVARSGSAAAVFDFLDGLRGMENKSAHYVRGHRPVGAGLRAGDAVRLLLESGIYFGVVVEALSNDRVQVRYIKRPGERPVWAMGWFKASELVRIGSD